MPALNGDSQAASYGWGFTLDTGVVIGAAADIPTPGFDLRYTDVRYPKLLVRSAGSSLIYRGGDGVEIVFDQNDVAPKATITNQTDKAWLARTELYLFCPHVLAHADNDWDLREQIWDLQQRVSKLEGTSAE